ncbi:MAG: EF-P beta-lysylation protein EpmB [Marinobacter sp.]|uniref:EF-P beta-lysylation protein EpmB n=1 Tax=Marinobacter sp. TaxID=50741 RepID=UPI0034A0468C
MIQRTPAPVEAHPTDISGQSWQQLLSDCATTPEKLLESLGLDPGRWLTGATAGHRLFPIRVPQPYLERIERGNPQDPLLRQVLPLEAESQSVPGFVRDPLGEKTATPTPGLIQKYRSRALLMIAGQCAINCRYCFRRHFPYAEHRMSPDERKQVIDLLRHSPEINEVIFSGGDPLIASDRLLARWADELATVRHLKRLRIHTRLPVVIPQRVDDALLAWLVSSRLQKVIVLHINHPNEIDRPVADAIARLKSTGATVLNQSVILKGVNDNADILIQLSETLFEAGVLPYYLHAFDPVEGAHHFEVSDDDARDLVRCLLDRLPGFLVPRLVRETPGKTSKTPLDLFVDDRR